jgi:hypothetical protein
VLDGDDTDWFVRCCHCRAVGPRIDAFGEPRAEALAWAAWDEREEEC